MRTKPCAALNVAFAFSAEVRQHEEIPDITRWTAESVSSESGTISRFFSVAGSPVALRLLASVATSGHVLRQPGNVSIDCGFDSLCGVMKPETELDLTNLRAQFAKLEARHRYLLAIFRSATISPGSRRDSGGALDSLRLEIGDLRRKIAEIDQL